MEDNTTCEKDQKTVPEVPPKENEVLVEKSEPDTPQLLTRALISAVPNECKEGYRRNSDGECVPVFD